MKFYLQLVNKHSNKDIACIWNICGPESQYDVSLCCGFQELCAFEKNELHFQKAVCIFTDRFEGRSK